MTTLRKEIKDFAKCPQCQRRTHLNVQAEVELLLRPSEPDLVDLENVKCDIGRDSRVRCDNCSWSGHVSDLLNSWSTPSSNLEPNDETEAVELRTAGGASYFVMATHEAEAGRILLRVIHEGRDTPLSVVYMQYPGKPADEGRFVRCQACLIECNPEPVKPKATGKGKAAKDA